MENNSKSELQKSNNDNITAILAYAFPIGWFISYIILYKDNKNDFTIFHIRQGLGVQILFVVAFLVGLGFGFLDFIPFNNTLAWIIKKLGIILMIIGVITAVNKEMKPLPVIGKMFQDMFKGVK